MNSADSDTAREPGVRFRLSSKVSYTRVLDECVAIEKSAGEVLVLNEIGGRVLELCGQELSVPAMVDLLEGEYAVDRSVLERDVPGFLAQLTEAGLVEPREA